MRIKVYVTFDTEFRTWNVMRDGKCIFYGDAFAVDEFLETHQEYEEL